ncbi:flagellar biosynthesis anti-sigma factor FlgM [Brenneria tiliae]|uniref:flagellar biosynthesis anti-sigma factor FlgM n=1 Tax=Brenneria tiliae TaxID=2914984 RepID=UPI002014DCF3|nr:flagellar biosynthesis anti-sigma factor FlgM [Brenneria tiliae]MCL2899814.1 anti-sigma-28 factor FlgM [Brenneria tiliae]MCL2904697.1 anti-sigma-28 factor FlgM [Brenneria tiliae]
MSISGAKPVASPQAIQSKEADTFQAQKSKAASVSSGTEKETQVILSNAQAQLMQPGTQDIDLGKVENLKQAIQAGELQIDVGKIADKLISLSDDLTQD